MATADPAKEAQSRALKGSASPITATSVRSPGARPAAPVPQSPAMATPITTRTGTAALNQRWGAPAGGWREASVGSDAGVEPGRMSPCPDAARASASYIGPKSRRIRITIRTKMSARIG